jgi:hypothetical protein
VNQEKYRVQSEQQREFFLLGFGGAKQERKRKKVL